MFSVTDVKTHFVLCSSCDLQTGSPLHGGGGGSVSSTDGVSTVACRVQRRPVVLQQQQLVSWSSDGPEERGQQRGSLRSSRRLLGEFGRRRFEPEEEASAAGRMFEALS